MYPRARGTVPRPFSFTGQDTPKPASDHWKAGASFGGPLIIPHLVQGHGQFFVNYQLTRNNTANTLAGLVPDSLERSGDLLGIVIPQNRISPQAKALLDLYPLPNFDASTRYNYQISTVAITHQDDLQSRVTKNLNSKPLMNEPWSDEQSSGISLGTTWSE